MGCRINRALAVRTLQTGILLLLASTANSIGLIDRMHSIAEQAWEDEYIPDSGIPTIPLTEYDDFEVTELFRAVTIEDIEAAITDGYPMAWLEEILKDETIPWEDRYWLDCRMRAVIAQDLHTFFNPAGNPISVEADFIIPGEDYWREHLMVNPLGESDMPEELRPTTIYADPGYILDRFGNQVGELAEVFRFVTISRDACIAAVISGGEREPLACLMYPDGTFREIPLPQPGRYESVVSANGEVIAFECVAPAGTRDPVTFEPTGVTGEVYFFDPTGNLISRVAPPAILSGGERCKLSSDGNYFCDNLSTGGIFLYQTNADTQILHDGSGRILFNFSPDSRFLCAPGYSSGVVVDILTAESYWESSYVLQTDYEMSRISCSNKAECIASVTRRGAHPDFTYDLEVILGNQLVYRDVSEDRYSAEVIVSPNGHFLLSQKGDVKIGDSGIPTVIRQIRGGDSE